MLRHYLASLFLLAAAALLFAACEDGTLMDTNSAPKATTQQPGGGPGGGQQQTFRIANLRQLEKLANKNPGGHFVQVKDLKGRQIDPIGSAATPFTGTYDGNGYEISGLTIKRPGDSGIGLFAVTDGAEIKNVTLNSVDVRGQSQVGALVGVNEGKVEDSEATGVVTASGSGASVGGLVGENKGTITGSSSAVTTNGDKKNTSDVGGLVGINRSGGEITSSSATGDVQGRIEVGGLVGTNEGTVRQSFALGNAESEDFTVGGLAGVNRGGTIAESFAEGDATSINKGTAGGLVGLNTTDGTSGGTISDSYATGTATGVSQPNGGFVGSNLNGTIKRSFTVGDAQGGLVGGFAGKNEDTITDGYWDKVVSSQTVGIGSNKGTATVTGLSTVQMQGSRASSNMSALDFQNTWTTVPDDYPALQWE